MPEPKAKPPLIRRKAFIYGTAGNRDSIRSKIFEGERVGFGEGEGKHSLESFPSPSPIVTQPQYESLHHALVDDADGLAF